MHSTMALGAQNTPAPITSSTIDAPGQTGGSARAEDAYTKVKRCTLRLLINAANARLPLCCCLHPAAACCFTVPAKETGFDLPPSCMKLLLRLLPAYALDVHPQADG